MIKQTDLKKCKKFNDLIFLYNNFINYKSLKNCVILLTYANKNIVIIDTEFQAILFKSKHYEKNDEDMNLSIIFHKFKKQSMIMFILKKLLKMKI